MQVVHVNRKLFYIILGPAVSSGHKARRFYSIYILLRKAKLINTPTYLSNYQKL